jgi:ATP-dependent protease Clp ATPase subunit
MAPRATDWMDAARATRLQVMENMVRNVGPGEWKRLHGHDKIAVDYDDFLFLVRAAMPELNRIVEKATR